MWEAGQPFQVQDVDRRAPGPGEVVVRLRAAGVCQTDVSLSRGAFGQTMPVVLGHEGAGEVLELGPGVESVTAGDRVVLTWVPACGRCYFCVRGETYLCSERRRAGERGDAATRPDLSAGGRPVQAGLGTATFAEETVVPASSVIPLPDDLPFELAALLGCAVPTGLGAVVNSAQVRPGETVVVVGCGAVGLSAVQGAVIGGASVVVAVDPHAARRELAEALGATTCLPPADPDTDRPVAPVGYDVGIDAVGSSGTIRATWDLVRRGGRVVVVGAGRADDPVLFSAQELFHAQKHLIGSFYGSSDMRRDVPRMIALWRSGRLDLAAMLSGTARLEDINDVVDRQTSGRDLRLVLTP